MGQAKEDQGKREERREREEREKREREGRGWDHTNKMPGVGCSGS